MVRIDFYLIAAVMAAMPNRYDDACPRRPEAQHDFLVECLWRRVLDAAAKAI